MKEPWSVPAALAAGIRTAEAAIAAAGAVGECRVINALILGLPVANKVDERLYAIELAYYRRADELKQLAKPAKKRTKR